MLDTYETGKPAQMKATITLNLSSAVKGEDANEKINFKENDGINLITTPDGVTMSGKLCEIKGGAGSRKLVCTFELTSSDAKTLTVKPYLGAYEITATLMANPGTSGISQDTNNKAYSDAITCGGSGETKEVRWIDWKSIFDDACKYFDAQGQQTVFCCDKPGDALGLFEWCIGDKSMWCRAENIKMLEVQNLDCEPYSISGSATDSLLADLAGRMGNIYHKTKTVSTANMEVWCCKKAAQTPAPVVCGDGKCDGGENCTNCEKDCGKCPPATGCKTDSDCKTDKSKTKCDTSTGKCVKSVEIKPECTTDGDCPDESKICSSSKTCTPLNCGDCKKAENHICVNVQDGSKQGKNYFPGWCCDGTWTANGQCCKNTETTYCKPYEECKNSICGLKSGYCWDDTVCGSTEFCKSWKCEPVQCSNECEEPKDHICRAKTDGTQCTGGKCQTGTCQATGGDNSIIPSIDIGEAVSSLMGWGGCLLCNNDECRERCSQPNT